MIDLTINGKEKQLEGPMGLISYLETLNLNMKFIAVAHNGEVVPRDELGDVGINQDNVTSVIGAGASGVAIISAIAASPDPETAASALKRRMVEAWAQVETKGFR